MSVSNSFSQKSESRFEKRAKPAEKFCMKTLSANIKSQQELNYYTKTPKRKNRNRLDRQFDRTLEICESEPELASIAFKIRQCSPHKRCGRYECRHCGRPFSETWDTHKADFKEIVNFDPDIIFEDDLQCSELDKDYKRRPTGNARLDHGERCHRFWLDNRDEGVFPATINIDLLPFGQWDDPFNFGGSVKKRAKAFRRKFSTLCKKRFPHMKHLGWLEDVIVQIESRLDFDIQDKSWKQSAGGKHYAVKLHIHMLVSGVSREEFNEALKQEGFGASKQVRSAKLKPVKMVGGHKKGHARGWGEYMAKMFQFFDFGDDNDWLLLFHSLYRTEFSKSNRLVSRGVNANPHHKAFRDFIHGSGPSYDNHEFHTPEDLEEWSWCLSAPIEYLTKSEIGPSPEELIDPYIDAYEELIDAPSEYEFIPRYGVPHLLKNNISWKVVTDFHEKLNSLSLPDWVTTVVTQASSIIDHTVGFKLLNLCNSGFKNSTPIKGLRALFSYFSPLSHIAINMRKRE